MLIERETIFHLIPELRCYYVEWTKARLFASLGVGLRTKVFTETVDGDTVGNTRFTFSCQIVPIGMEIGTKFYINFAFGAGYAWAPATIGIGYRFGQ